MLSVLYILLHDWEGNTGKYFVRDRPYRPDETILRSRTLYFPTRGNAIIDLLYDLRVTIGTGNN